VAEQELRVMQARRGIESAEQYIRKSPILERVTGGRLRRLAAKEAGLFVYGAAEEAVGASQRLGIAPKRQVTERKLETFGLGLALIPPARLTKAALGLKGLEKRGLATVGYMQRTKQGSKVMGTTFKTPRKLEAGLPLKRTEFAAEGIVKGRLFATKGVFATTGFKKGISPLAKQWKKGDFEGATRSIGLRAKDLSAGFLESSRKGRITTGAFIARAKTGEIGGKPFVFTLARLKTTPTRFLRSYEIEGAGAFRLLKKPTERGTGGLILKQRFGRQKRKTMRAAEGELKKQTTKYIKMGSSPLPKPASPRQIQQTYMEYGLLGQGGLPPQLGIKSGMKLESRMMLGTKTGVALKSKSKSMLRQRNRTKLNFKQKTGTQLKLKPLSGLGLRSKLKPFQKQKLMFSPTTPMIPNIGLPKAFAFGLPFGKKRKPLKSKKKKGKTTLKRRARYAPSLIGTALPKTLKPKTKGLFTGLEIRRR
jgi:hypothetical protein